ncbi:2'-5' RNA ligase family protein [Microbacterium gorillae]|uniref:2'-5' RNA ligase family protein n=1 Tax=Microbacterium gorillae TaxID=1231063 RepID=UPI00058EBCF1|nr:2'-5' RNA ligase family protein [Microbacterium gorillae]
MTREPIVADRAWQQDLRSAQALVLRPGGAFLAAFTEAQAAARAAIGDRARYPGCHVTIANLAAGNRLIDLETRARFWAARTAPLRVVGTAVETFPDPFRVLHLQIQSAPALRQAMSAARGAVKAAQLTDSAVVPVEEWTFHASIAYGDGIPADEWEQLTAPLRATLATPAVADVDDAEFVWFDESGERSLALPLGGL